MGKARGGSTATVPIEDKVFNPRRRSLRRTHVSTGEAAFGICVLILLALIVCWVFSKRDDYDPADRDIETAVLAHDSVADTLYRAPLKRWVDSAGGETGSAVPDLGVFPSAILEGGWRPSSRLQRFDPERLYEKIDGAAEQYIQLGFEELHYLSIEQPEAGLDIGIELYDMARFQNALGIFAAQKDADQAMETRDQTHYYTTEAGAIGVFANFYFRLAGNENTPAIREKALELVAALSSIDAEVGQIPEPFLVLSKGLGIPFGQIAYERGDVFQYNFAKDFWFGQPDTSSGLRYYLHQARDEAAAAALFDKLLENHLLDYTLVERDGNNVILKHQFLDSFLTLHQTGNLVFGVDVAPDVATAEEALGTLRNVLLHDESG